MIYQKIYTGARIYGIGVGGLSKFPEHRHADFEFNYCIEGYFDVIIDGRTYHVREGSAAFIPPMCAHRIPEGNHCRTVTLVVGVAALGDHFDEFLALSPEPCVYDLQTAENGKIAELFLECAAVHGDASASAELTAKGNVYKLLAYFYKLLSERKGGAEIGVRPSDSLSQIERIEKALEMIRFGYKNRLTVEAAAECTGYGKSNFCKIFKKCVGEGFHQALNRQRAESAAALLSVSDLSIADIAIEVGFGEAKTFCRVFKSLYGVSPGEYRRKRKVTANSQ